jgi:hypothetical protein
VLYLLAFTVFALAALCISFVTGVAGVGVAVRGHGVLEAIGEAFTLFRRHWLVSVEMIVVLLAVNIGLVIIMLAALVALTIPFFLLLMAAGVIGSSLMASVIAVIGVIALIAVIAVFGSFLAFFQQAAWTLLYLRLGERTVVAKIHRIFRSYRPLRARA